MNGRLTVILAGAPSFALSLAKGGLRRSVKLTYPRDFVTKLGTLRLRVARTRHGLSPNLPAIKRFCRFMRLIAQSPLPAVNDAATAVPEIAGKWVYYRGFVRFGGK